MDGWMDGWMDGRMDGMDGRKGRIDGGLYLNKPPQHDEADNEGVMHA
jgi:hypothetical protein